MTNDPANKGLAVVDHEIKWKPDGGRPAASSIFWARSLAAKPMRFCAKLNHAELTRLGLELRAEIEQFGGHKTSNKAARLAQDGFRESGHSRAVPAGLDACALLTLGRG
jgi:hypothetical protein